MEKMTATYFLKLLLMVALMSFIYSTLSAQKSQDNLRITANYKQVPLKKVLKDISAKTSVPFSYSPRKIPVDSIITAHFENKPLDDVLNEIFMGLPVNYEWVDDYIVLKKGPVNEKSPEAEKPEKFTISGYLRDNTDGEFLIGATVFVKENNIGTITNNYGFFSITLPEGKYNLSLSYIGFEEREQAINLKSNVRIDLGLTSLPQKIAEVSVFSASQEEKIFKMHAAQSKLLTVNMSKLPALMGEPDVIKNLAYQPGISMYNDGSSYFSVRGGNYDQNLIILDEATIFNPSHLLGLFTPIIPDAVSSVDIYKADFPVNYGGRLSSVIDIHTRDGNKSHFSGSGAIGLLSLRGTVEGPFKKDASSYFISFRRSYFDRYFKAIDPSLLDLYFYDFTAKANIRAGHKNRLFITLYKSQDQFRNAKNNNDASGIDWSNNSLTLRWNHIFGPRVFLNSSLYASKYDFYLRTSVKNGEYWNSRIGNTSLKEELTFYATPDLTWKYGIVLGGYDFNPGNYYSPAQKSHIQVSPVTSSEATIYGGAEQTVLPWLKINYGLRHTGWKDYGEGFLVHYTADHQVDSVEYIPAGKRFYKHSAFEPRLSLSILTGKTSSLKIGYSRTQQYLNLINNSISPFNALDVWLPAGPNIKPQAADIWDLGYITVFQKKALTLRTDLFYKKMYNQIGYKDHANMLINPYIEGEIRQGKGYSYGLEISLEKETGKLTGLVSYTYSRAFLHIPELNGGQKFPAAYDRPHYFTLSATDQLRPRWSFSANLILASGSKVTTPVSFYTYQGYQVPDYGTMNNDHFPFYSRFDISSTWQLNKPGHRFNHSLTFSVFNLLGQQNPVLVNFNQMPGPDGKFVVPANASSVTLSPTIRYVYNIIPSFFYQFRF